MASDDIIFHLSCKVFGRPRKRRRREMVRPIPSYRSSSAPAQSTAAMALRSVAGAACKAAINRRQT